MLNSHLIAKTSPKASPKQIILLGNTRITVLTPTLVRVETSDTQDFCDSATQIVWYRNLKECEYSVDFDEKWIVITTERAVFHYNRKKSKMCHVILEGKKIKCNNKSNLKGTARTLDMTSGKIPLKNGIIGKNGVAIMPDKSLILGEDGKVHARQNGTDIYIFASTDYRKSLDAFFQITGAPPMIPRYAVGNWWSRYHAYTADKYLSLMDEFSQQDIPFSVATIDMDWHWVNIPKQFGKEYKGVRGWTGYSWNTDLFPNYKEFLQQLKERNLGVLMNLHPAKGVRSYEDAYKDMSIAMGIDPATKQTVEFDFTDAKFINAYFSILHRPYEKDGVDAWWIDWQQGKKTKLAGYDPLWGLNHYHTLDNEYDNKRPLILSRYAGLGSHRYPLGFSGDTIVLWSALRFQPYFTNTAANAGYTAWSHDIGGHHFGRQSNQELYLRWLQYGVFTPVLRLHSSTLARSKEPWNFPEVADIAKEFLRLRHRLVPYIYSLYYRAYAEGRAICEPMYYKHPKRKEAYKMKNQYYFGSEMLVLPITSPIKKSNKLASIKAWLPRGRYVDLFTSDVYNGDGIYTIKRPLSSIPVLMREGAILPLSNNVGNDVSNPANMDIFVYSGNNSFTLYEDDGISTDYKKGKSAKTKFTISKKEDKSAVFTIDKVVGDTSLIPQERTFNVYFKDINDFDDYEIKINDKLVSIDYQSGNFSITGVAPDSSVEIRLSNIKTI